MESRKCMIAGLPSSGKSTYIGALWYNLCNSNKNMLMSAGELPVHIELLEKLSDLWQKIQKIETVKSCEVEITFDPPWSKDLMSEEAKLELGML